MTPSPLPDNPPMPIQPGDVSVGYLRSGNTGNPVLDEISTAHAKLSPQAQQAIEGAHGALGISPSHSDPALAASTAPSPELAVPGVSGPRGPLPNLSPETPVMGMSRGADYTPTFGHGHMIADQNGHLPHSPLFDVDPVSGRPTILGTSGTPMADGQSATDPMQSSLQSGVPEHPGSVAVPRSPGEAELSRLRTDGPGVNSIRNPFVRGLAKTGDVLGSTFARGLFSNIPGSTAHNLQLQERAAKEATEEQASAKNVADVAHTGAQTAEARSNAALADRKNSELATDHESPQAARDRRSAEADAEGLKGREKAEFVESGKMPTASPQGTKKTEHWELPDGSSVYVEHDSKTGTRYLGDDEWSIPEGAKLAASSTARPTIQTSDYVNLDAARKLLESGFPVVGENGKPIDVDSVPKGMVLQKIHFADGKTVYQPRNINDKTVKLGNVVYAVEPDKLQQIPQGEGTAIGIANSGGSRMPSTIDTVNGQPVVVPGSSTPNTPGAFRQAPVSGGRPGVAPVPVKTNGVPAAPQAQPNRSTPPVASVQQPRGGLPVGLYSKSSDTAKSMGSLAAQIFGSDEDPGIHGMQDFAHLADDPAAVKRIGTALTMLNSYKPELAVLGNTALNGYILNGGVGTGPLLPVGIHAGGSKTGGTAAHSSDITPEKASEINGQVQRAMSALTPEERAYLVAMRTAKESIIGLRKLTGGSATDASMQALQNIVPQIGSGSGFVGSKAEYDDAVRRMAAEVFRSVGRVPAGMIEPGMMDRLNRVRGSAGAGSAAPQRPTSVPANAQWNSQTRHWEIP